MCTPGTKLNVGFEQLLQKELKLTEKRESVKAQMWRRLTKQGMDSGEGCGH